MAKADGNIDTQSLGMALSFFSPGKHEKKGPYWKVVFDTGIILFVPDAIFGTMQFHLQEKD